MKLPQKKFHIIHDKDLDQILNLIRCLREAIYERITETSTADYCGVSELEYWEEISKIYSDDDLPDLKEVF